MLYHRGTVWRGQQTGCSVTLGSWTLRPWTLTRHRHPHHSQRTKMAQAVSGCSHNLGWDSMPWIVGTGSSNADPQNMLVVLRIIAVSHHSLCLCAAEYRLVAFVSHMGTSTLCGHYVCHILKEGRWVIYNDSKVAVSETPPKQLGYLYLYQRV